MIVLYIVQTHTCVAAWKAAGPKIHSSFRGGNIMAVCHSAFVSSVLWVLSRPSANGLHILATELLAHCIEYDGLPIADAAGETVSEGMIANAIQTTAAQTQIAMRYDCACHHRLGACSLHASPLSPNVHTFMQQH